MVLSFTVLSSSATLSALAVICFLFIVKVLAQVIYRCTFHPLRHIPGPWFNSVSDIPAALALVTGEQHRYYRALHEKYGPTVRVSPNELSFVGVDARTEIYGHRKGTPMEKSPIWLGAVGNVNGQTGVSLAIGADHVRQRKALGYLFTNSALRRFEDLIKIHIRKMITAWEEKAHADEPVDVCSWYTYLSFDIVGDLCFAEPFGCLDQASATEWSTSVINVFIAATWTQGIRRLSGVGTWLEKMMLKLLVPGQAAVWRKVHLDNSREKTLRRLADPDRDHPDFMSYILASNEAKKMLSETEIILNMALFISAGSDTTATVLTGWTYFICTHPEVYKRVVKEVREAIKSLDDITWDTACELRYLEATIHEALRLFPPSPASQQRVVPKGGATINGYYVPEGYTAAVSPWVSTHSTLNFAEPDTFAPERWLQRGADGGECDARFAADQLEASQPFGVGPHACPGKNLAYIELRLITAHILFQFDLALDRAQHRRENEVWGLDGRLRPMKVFHSMMKPELWVRMTRRTA